MRLKKVHVMGNAGSMAARRNIPQGLRDKQRERIEKTNAKLRGALERLRLDGGPFTVAELARKAEVSYPTVYEQQHRNVLEELRRLAGKKADEKREVKRAKTAKSGDDEARELKKLLRDREKNLVDSVRENRRLRQENDKLKKDLTRLMEERAGIPSRAA